jgi:hypothetical protein
LQQQLRYCAFERSRTLLHIYLFFSPFLPLYEKFSGFYSCRCFSLSNTEDLILCAYLCLLNFMKDLQVFNNPTSTNSSKTPPFLRHLPCVTHWTLSSKFCTIMAMILYLKLVTLPTRTGQITGP